MTSCREPLVSVVIPTLNERDNIEKLLPRLSQVLSSEGLDCHEIIVVDDGSTDGTRELVAAFSRLDPRVRLITRNERGLAGAIARGIREAKAGIVAVMDADFQHPPEVLPRLIRPLLSGQACIAVASRYTRGGGVKGWSRTRLLISLGAAFLAWILVPESRRTRDPMSGFFAIKKGKVVYNPLNPRGFKALLEILYENPGARVVEVPYVFEERVWGESKLGARTIIDYVLQLVKISRPLRFAVVGATGTLVNLGLMALLLTAGIHPSLASIMAVESSVLWNFALHEVFTFGSSFGGGLRNLIMRFLGFHASSAASAAVTVATASAFYITGLNPLVGQALGIILGYIANFLVASRVWDKWRGSG